MENKEKETKILNNNEMEQVAGGEAAHGTAAQPDGPLQVRQDLVPPGLVEIVGPPFGLDTAVEQRVRAVEGSAEHRQVLHAGLPGFHRQFLKDLHPKIGMCIVVGHRIPSDLCL